jgi:Zn-dependent peptidase ImmA (M78 family)
MAGRPCKIKVTVVKTDKNCQRFAKLKELQADTRANAFAAHLILPKRTKAHPPPENKTVENLAVTLDRNTFLKLNFA